MNKHYSTDNNHVLKQISKSIIELTDRYFDLYSQIGAWVERLKRLCFDFRDYIYATIMKKAGWFFILFILVPCIAMFDYSSIMPYIEYLSSTAGAVIGTIIKYTGFLMFVALEIAIGWLICNFRGNLVKNIITYLLAVVITLVPMLLIYATYAITEHKTGLLLSKTLALMLMSGVLHVLVLMLATEIWRGILHNIYKFKNRRLQKEHPHKEMQRVKKQLQEYFADYDLYVTAEGTTGTEAELSSRSLYLKQKFQQGKTGDEYDLSDYDHTKTYK